MTSDARSLLDARPDAVVEVLGGLEPARSLVLEAIEASNLLVVPLDRLPRVEGWPEVPSHFRIAEYRGPRVGIRVVGNA